MAVLVILAAFGSLTGGGVAALPQQAEPVGGESTFGIHPASEQGVATRPAFVYELDPGSEITDAVRVRNLGDSPLTLRLAPHDAFNTATGGFDVLPSGAVSNEVGTWVELAALEVEIPAGGVVDVPFRLTVPTNATPGDHAGGIVASLMVPTVGDDGTEMLVDHRVGTRVYIRVSGELRPGLVVSNFESRFEPEGVLGVTGSVVTTYTVHNAGNVRLAAEQSLEISSPLGLVRRNAELGAIPELLPGGQYTATVTTDDVRAFVRLTSTLTVDPVVVPSQRVEATASTWAVPWRFLGVIAMVVAIVVWRRRQRHIESAGTGTPQPSGEVADADADADTTSLARAVLMVALLAVAPPSVVEPPAGAIQTVSFDRQQAVPGDIVTVSLDGWPQGPAQVELCGNAAQRGSVDCNSLGGVAASVSADGTARLRLALGEPPVPCPCVVRVTQQHTGAAATVPIDIPGFAGVVTADETVGNRQVVPIQRRLEVVGTTIEADESWRAWFGGDVGRVATVTVRNDGNVAITGVVVSARLDGGLDTSIVIPSPPPFDLAPGEERDVDLAFELPSPAIGDYRIEGRVDGTEQPIEFSIPTRHMPWGLINAVVLLIGTWLVLSARRRARRRRHVPVAPTSAAVPADLPVRVEVVDVCAAEAVTEQPAVP